ncbi:hypothetical protein ACJX0J_022289, partial [Zea mays]
LLLYNVPYAHIKIIEKICRGQGHEIMLTILIPLILINMSYIFETKILIMLFYTTILHTYFEKFLCEIQRKISNNMTQDELIGQIEQMEKIVQDHKGKEKLTDNLSTWLEWSNEYGHV